MNRGGEWTMGQHGRKCLRCCGSVLDGGVARSDELVFWGEWEAQSVAETITDPLPEGGPRWPYHPFWWPPDSYQDI